MSQSGTRESCYERDYELQEDLRRLNLEAEFDFIINSAVVGAVKPGKEFFIAALEASGLKPGEALFVDDNPIHTSGAQKLGIASHVFSDLEQLRHALFSFGLLAKSV